MKSDELSEHQDFEGECEDRHGLDNSIDKSDHASPQHKRSQSEVVDILITPVPPPYLDSPGHNTLLSMWSKQSTPDH
ncbi:hypothetical protein Pmani_032141 [Petrolisthes manimaculis]|uniref:Uncharacterized protein n=1 Tax=Petrolisthes manimaculis TaxID=1843537 RepID=A0AAE1NTW9_9EUCA|nr:hypothetical protein Pmani_032141 [Petrolisthes manimaculis]